MDQTPDAIRCPHCGQTYWQASSQMRMPAAGDATPDVQPMPGSPQYRCASRDCPVVLHADGTFTGS